MKLDPLTYFKELVAAVERLHEENVVHGRINPMNVVLASDGRIKLVDTLPSNPYALSHPGHRYLSPEQLRGKKPTKKSDIYALGLLGYEIFTGKYPYRGNVPYEITAAILYEEPLPSDLPESVRPFIMGALQKSPRRRPKSFSRPRRKPFPVVIMAGLILAVATAGTWLWRKDSEQVRDKGRRLKSSIRARNVEKARR